MPKNINAASRLHAVLSQTTNMSVSATSLAVWENVFQVQTELIDARKASIISERLRWLHLELDILRSQMRQGNFSETLYTAAFNRIEQAVSPLLLPTTWNNGLQYLSPETMVSLEFCSEILPDEEALIDPQALEEIRSMVLALEGLLETTNLPESVITVIRHHIELINRSLDLYPIVGAKVLQDAARTAVGELLEVKEIIEANNTTEEVCQLGKIWAKFNNVVDIAIKTDNVAQISTKAWALLQNVIDMAS